MDVMRNLFNRNTRKNGIQFTEVTLLRPGAFSERQRDLVGFTDTHTGQNTTVAPSGDKRVFRGCRVSPMKDMVDRQPVYTKEDLKRIADMFLVSYTHSANEDDLPSYQKKNTKKNAKGARKLFKQIHKIIK